MTSFLRRLLPPYTLRGSSSTVCGIPYYSNKHYDEKWFQNTVGKYRDFLLWIDSVYYWVKYRFVNKHHIVDTGLKPGYHDVDELIFHACFQLLGRFVEDELGKEEGGYKGYRVEVVGDVNQKAIDLWLFYRNHLPKLIEELENGARNYNESADHNAFVERTKNSMLLRLIEIRSSLWT